jgi:hypothetical protein
MQAKKMTPSVQLEEISPHKAAELLKFNHSNRRMIPNHLNRLISEMLNGDWRVTGDTIKLNGERLLDGQHRLEAVVRSGVTIWSYVARNVDTDAFDMIDTGRSRQGGDVLSALGYHNVFLTASSARMVWYFEHRISRLDGAVSNHAIVNCVKRHDDLPAFVSDINSHNFCKTGAVAGALYWLMLADRIKADDFIDGFTRGAELKITSPIYVLRERVINDRLLRATKTGRQRLVAMVFRTWDNWLEGRAASYLKATRPDEAGFPWPKGAPYLV